MCQRQKDVSDGGSQNFVCKERDGLKESEGREDDAAACPCCTYPWGATVCARVRKQRVTSYGPSEGLKEAKAFASRPTSLLHPSVPH